jgi:uncharacterized protein YndB with AHSA1/START domain
LKKDASGRRYVEMELEVPGTPEQVWQAVATGPGYSAWFTPTKIEEREGGAVRFDTGGGLSSAGRVTAWQPPRRFRYEETDWSGDAPPLATEITVEARAGGICRIRMVHSLFTSNDDWDSEMEGFEKGWPGFFNILRIYLQDFAGMRAASARLMGSFPGNQDEAWQKVRQSLGLNRVAVGDRRDTSVNGGPQLVGTVRHATEKPDHRELTLVLDKPSPGVALIGTFHYGGKVNVAVSLILYGDEADAVLARENPKWDAWMGEHFPAPNENNRS